MSDDGPKSGPPEPPTDDPPWSPDDYAAEEHRRRPRRSSDDYSTTWRRGWAKHRDIKSVSKHALRLWLVLLTRDLTGQGVRVGRDVLAADIEEDMRCTERALRELRTAGLVTVKRTGRTSRYIVHHPAPLLAT